MKIHIKIFLLVILIVFDIENVIAQTAMDVDYLIASAEVLAEKGDRRCLKDLIKYAKDNRVPVDHFNSRDKTPVGESAEECLHDLTSFSIKELNPILYKKRIAFSNFLKANFNKLNYYENMQYWGFSSLQERKIKSVVRHVNSGPIKKEPGKLFCLWNDNSQNGWYENKENGMIIYANDSDQVESISSLWQSKDSKLLLALGSMLFIDRSYANVRYSIIIKYFTSLTDLQIGVADKQDKIAYEFPDDDDLVMWTNYICFWLQNYQKFSWDESKQKFIYSEK